MRVLWLSIGGVLGVNARYWLALGIDRLLTEPARFPWATLTINVSGAFVLGFLATIMARLEPHHPARLACLVGFLGGYTTFSTFALEAQRLMDSGGIGRSLAYMLSSVAGGVVAVALGILLARSLGFDAGHAPRLAAARGMGLAEVD